MMKASFEIIASYGVCRSTVIMIVMVKKLLTYVREERLFPVSSFSYDLWSCCSYYMGGKPKHFVRIVTSVLPKDPLCYR